MGQGTLCLTPSRRCGFVARPMGIGPGDELAPFMESSVRASDFVLIVCTRSYKAKSDHRTGGVGYEGSVITAELVTGAPRRKFIPILRSGEWRDSSPSWLLGSLYLDFRGESTELEEPYAELLNTLHGRRETPTPVGSAPFPERHRPEAEQREPQKPTDQSWPYVWQALMDARPGDPELTQEGMVWLQQSSPEDSGWPYVWRALMESRPGDPELLHMGAEWLRQSNANNPAWTFVWKRMLDLRPGDPELLHIGQQWLQQR